MRNKEIVRTTIGKLRLLEIEGLFPNIDYEPRNHEVGLTQEEIDYLTKEHFKSIKNSDAIYFIVPNNYMGTSCKLELGYARALSKPIYFSGKMNDVALDVICKKVISLHELKKLKNEF